MDFTRGLKADPAPGAFLWRGQARLASGDASGAALDFTSAIRGNADWATVYDLRAEAYARLGLREEAIADLEKCLAIGGETADAERRRKRIEALRGRGTPPPRAAGVVPAAAHRRP